MVPRKIKDQYHLRFRKLHKFQQLPKTRVILILNFTRPHAITYTYYHYHYYHYHQYNVYIS